MVSESLRSVEKAFFDAMNHGWASGNNGEPIDGSLGWKAVVYYSPDGKHRVIDRWGEDLATKKPTGSILITTMDNTPEWVMWYGGENYGKWAIPILRKSLMENYSQRIFYGGRGPKNIVEGEFVYVNQAHGDFVKFSGYEVITNTKGTEFLGGHNYWGGSLLHLA